MQERTKAEAGGDIVPIDAVITWVDGNDPVHQQKRRHALERLEGKSMPTALNTGTDKTRFLDNGEIYYCIRSIRKFAPWIRHIYVITDNQLPDFLKTAEDRARFGVHIVDHTEVFNGHESALPCFNGRSLESVIWRIPGIAERFIYFNDDFVLTAPVQPRHFYRGSKVVLRGTWQPVITYGAARIAVNKAMNRLAKRLLGITRSMHLLLQITSARLAGFNTRYYRAPHVPHPVNRKTIADWCAAHPDQFERNIQFKFRDMSQFSGVFLANHLEIKRKNAKLKRGGKAMMINGETDRWFILGRKLKRVSQGKVRFLCLQGFERFSDASKKRIHDTLETVLR